jgi:hypothetical protein
MNHRRKQRLKQDLKLWDSSLCYTRNCYYSTSIFLTIMYCIHEKCCRKEGSSNLFLSG